MRRLFIITALLLATLLFGCGGQQPEMTEPAEDVNVIEEVPEETEPEIEKIGITVDDLYFTRDSATAIRLDWPSYSNDLVSSYLVMRSPLPASDSSWTQIG